jgi:hypothetical protein
MLSELSALTPPLLVAAAFLIAAGAFIRHEMRRGKNKPDDEESADSLIDSSRESGINEPGSGSAQRSFSDTTGDHDQDPGSRLLAESKASRFAKLALAHPGNRVPIQG